MRSAPAQTAWAAAAVLIVGIGIGMLIGYRIGRWRHCKTCLYRELWNPERPFEALKAAMASWDEVEPKKDEMDGITKIFLEKAKQDLLQSISPRTAWMQKKWQSPGIPWMFTKVPPKTRPRRKRQ